jgi:hypothetical protein
MTFSNIVQLKQVRFDMEALREDKSHLEVSFCFNAMRYICYTILVEMYVLLTNMESQLLNMCLIRLSVLPETKYIHSIV